MVQTGARETALPASPKAPDKEYRSYLHLTRPLQISLQAVGRDLSVSRVTDGLLNQIRVGAWSLNLAGWDDLLNHPDALSSWYQDYIMEQGGAVSLSEPHI